VKAVSQWLDERRELCLKLSTLAPNPIIAIIIRIRPVHRICGHAPLSLATLDSKGQTAEAGVLIPMTLKRSITVIRVSGRNHELRLTSRLIGMVPDGKLSLSLPG
jgi:hypothetical protein